MKSPLKIWQLLLCASLVVSVVACAGGPKFKYESDATLRALLAKEAPAYPEANFVVFSDPHIYDSSLGTDGKAFQAYLASDRKLLKESPEILEAAIEAIKKTDAKLVLVPGDLTKDGERSSHLLAANYLRQLEDSGKQVYVVPGNHDIRNGHSYRYVGDITERVPNITTEEFAQIYSDFGFKEALQRDSASLSYLVEPQPGLWLLALDSCRYKENIEGHEPITDGKFSHATLQWIEDRLAEAATKGKAVMVIMHHVIMEHYTGQEKNFGDYIIDDYQVVSKLLASYNVRLVFTGHYHAQDIAVERWPEDKFVFDIETGSLVTYPCPYRIVKMDVAQKANIQTSLVKAIRSHPTDFQQYGLAYIREGIKGIAARTIQGYKVDRAEAEELAGQVADAFVAHYSGDEKLAPGKETLRTSGLSLMGWIVVTLRKNLVDGLWHDLEPADNNITIDLKTGKWY